MYNFVYNMQDKTLDTRNLQKWNCIIQPMFDGEKYYGGLYLADVDCAQDAYLLQHLNIGALLSVIDEPQIILPNHLNYIARQKIVITDNDHESLIEYFPRCSSFMDYYRAHTNVMVHCFAGISRSASVVIAYLMEKFDWGYEKTFEIVRAQRNQIQPNNGFVQQLYKFEKYLSHKKTTENGIMSTDTQSDVCYSERTIKTQLNVSILDYRERITQTPKSNSSSPQKSLLKYSQKSLSKFSQQSIIQRKKSFDLNNIYVDLNALREDITRRQLALQQRHSVKMNEILNPEIQNTKLPVMLSKPKNEAKIYHFPIYKIKNH